MSTATNTVPVAKTERLISILLVPHVSEKSARISEKNGQYVFRVRRDASKPEIRAAVELMFSVEVDAVQVVNVAGKQKRFGAMMGRRSDWKKAYVSLKAGQEINFAASEQG